MGNFSSDASFFADGQSEENDTDGDANRMGPRKRRAPTAIGQPVLRRLRTQRRLAPLAMAATLLCTLLLVGIASYGARGEAIAAAQTRSEQDAQAARELLVGDGVTLSIVNGQLIRTGPAATVTLNGDATTVNHLRALLGEDVTLYQVTANDGGLVAVASSSHNITGAHLSGSPLVTLLGHCGAAALKDTVCHQPYAGVTQQAGTDVVAGFTPLFATDGAFLGAIAVTTPLNQVIMPSLQLMVVLLLVGLLVSLLTLILSYWLFGAFSGRVIETLSARLDDLAHVAASLERTARGQVAQTQRQEYTARQIGQQAHTLNTTIAVMEEGQGALHDVAGDIWAGISQPGAALDQQAATRLARQAAVMAARVGSSAEDAKLACRALVGLMNQVIAEDHLLTEQSELTSAQARELRRSIEQVEMALGGRLVKRRSLVGLDPVVARTLQTSRRLRGVASSASRRLRHPDHINRHVTEHRLRHAAQARDFDQRAAWDRDATWTAGDTEDTDRPDAFDTHATGATRVTGITPRADWNPPPDSNAGHTGRMPRTGQQRAVDGDQLRQTSHTPQFPQAPSSQSPMPPSGNSAGRRSAHSPGTNYPGKPGKSNAAGEWLNRSHPGMSAPGNAAGNEPPQTDQSDQQQRPARPSEWLND